ncbi:RNA-binding protein 39-like isoform X1 [Quercus lobata]|uniref:RNA-binding protein 39-like isoform X1 n=1 Tax=Quercus lobata TaxID=97700 RepID=UPI0012487311|nr:RNA-binding protein 39-like isoform X1 [Quercus lobata]
MDFDAYDYLEKTVENPEPGKEKEGAVNGGGEIEKSGDKERSRSSKHRSDERDDDVERRSKRSRSEDESRYRDRDRDRQRERGSSRHRSRSRDGERDRHRSGREQRDKERDRDREERNGNVKERDRDREKERGRDHDRERDRRERDRENEKDKEREKERSRRSRSESERQRGERDEREKSRDKELKERERERESRERDRESRRYKEKKEEVAEPEADPERDQRTVFAYQICLKANERDVYEFFSKAGKVRDVRLIMDRNSRRSKGVGYIEFYDAMSVPMAIALSGLPLLGQPVMVKPSEAEKNLVQSTTAVAGVSGGLIGPYSGGARRLYVGNLHYNITEADLRQVFEAFGQVELVQLPVDETGHCKGYGFVQFARLEDARNALSLNQQLEIAGRLIKVSALTDQAGMQDVGANSGDFDDDEGGGLSLNARSRALLMQKLDRSGSGSSVAGSTGTPVVNSTGLTLPTVPILGAAPAVSPITPLVPALAGLGGSGLQVPIATLPTVDTIGVPSECLLLKDMFDPNDETEPDFELDIKEDVQNECLKFGKLKHIFVDKNSAGFVYLRFENTQGAVAAQRALHGRWFAGKMITATYMVPQAYEAKFPDSR